LRHLQPKDRGIRKAVRELGIDRTEARRAAKIANLRRRLRPRPAPFISTTTTETRRGKIVNHSKGGTRRFADDGRFAMDEHDIAIHERAYAIWEQEGRPANQSLAHWSRAEAEIVNQSTVAKARAARPGSGSRPARKIIPDKDRAQERPRTFALAEITKIIKQRAPRY
jgi:hypothetical protein